MPPLETPAAALAAVVAGLALLLVGGEILIKSAVVLARAWRWPALFTGVVVVGFATSSPELAAVIQAQRAGLQDIAVGNVVGSNIANMALILALAALLAPLPTGGRALRWDSTVMAALTALVMLAFVAGGLGRLAAVVMMGFTLAYLFWRSRGGGGDCAMGAGFDAIGALNGKKGAGKKGAAALAFVAAVALLAFSAEVTVAAASALAGFLGASEWLIGLTVVAFGTSLPEAFAILAAARGGHPMLAAGNVVGSNIFNLALIMGTAALMKPLELSFTEQAYDLAALALLTALCVFLLARRGSLGWRWGLALAAFYPLWLTARGFTL